MTQVKSYRQSLAGGNHLGFIQLDRPAQLNALSYDMINSLFQQLTQWQSDDSITAVFLDSSSQKAFCAGGDIVAVYHSIKDEEKDRERQAINYFALEYRLDYLIHNYPKPIIAWCDGLIMGGGVGLFVGASHRIVTETSLMAMPEAKIGFFPDVGATYFLPRTQPGVGILMALTGCRINAVDAIDNGLADYLLTTNHKYDVIEGLKTLEFSGDSSTNEILISNLLSSLPAPELEATLLPRLATQLSELANQTSVFEQCNSILSWDNTEPYIAQFQQGLADASPLSLHLINAQLSQPLSMSLGECFQFELTLAYRCLELHEFGEGIRAHLVDKDKQPEWLYQTLNDVTDDCLAMAFSCVWPRNYHPLTNIEELSID